MSEPLMVASASQDWIRGPARTTGALWAVVLAGGEGLRLRCLVRQVFREERPKQYVPLLGPDTLLRQTLQRVALLIPPERTVVVTVQRHMRYVSEELSGVGSQHVLFQPLGRGTAAGILLPVHWISWRDPEATVLVFPSDHFILEETAFMAHVGEVAAWVDRQPGRIVLLGVRPTSPEADYGWIQPGTRVGDLSSGAIREVRRFWEKPGKEAAGAYLDAGWLWNTSVLVAKTTTLIHSGQKCVADLADRLARLAPFVGTEDEAWALRQAYALMPDANFSRDILEHCPSLLAVSTVPGVSWSDVGNRRRVFTVLRQIEARPSWLLAAKHLG